MKMKCFVILICMLSSIHGISYAQEIHSTKNNNTYYDEHAMRALFQYDNRKAEAKSLLEKQQEHFDWIMNYFANGGNIKSIDFIWTGEALTYTGQINESDYEQIRNNLDYIGMDSDFFDWGVKVNYWRDIVTSKIQITISDSLLAKKSNGFWCSEYFIYDKDGLPEKKENNPKSTTWQRKERINSNWYFMQNIRKISYANNNYIRLGDRKIKTVTNEWAKESNLLSFKRVKKIISKNSNKFNEFAKILNEKDAYFYYYRYLDYKHAADGKRYENLNEFTFHNKEARKNLMDENPNKKRCIAYCKKAESFIRLLEENNLVLSAGISIGCEDLGNGKSNMKIFTRTKAHGGLCLNVTIAYDGTGALREKDKSMKMLMPNWYYKSEIGEIQGLKAAE